MMTTIEKEFYSQLGLLATKFARSEQIIHLMCAHLSGRDIISERSKIERNTLSQNLKLLRKLSGKRNFESDNVQHLIDQFHPLKADRNRFLHSVWFKPYEVENSIQITCSDMKVVITESATGEKTVFESTHFTYDIEDIKHIIDRIEALIETQEQIFKRLKSLTFENEI